MIKFVLIGLKPLFDFIIYVDWAPAMRDKWRPIQFILSISSSFSCSIDQLPPELPPEMPSELPSELFPELPPEMPSELFPGLPPELPPELPPALAGGQQIHFPCIGFSQII